MTKFGNLELLIQYLSSQDADKVFRSHAEAYMWSSVDPMLSKKSLEYAVWNDKIKMLENTLYGMEKQYPMGGIWSPRDVNAHLTVYAGTDQKNNHIFAVFDDSISSDKYEAEWNGMWRYFNVMQFLTGFLCVSKNGLEDSVYSPLTLPAMNQVNTVVSDSGEWNEVMEMIAYSDSDAHEVIQFAIDHHFSIPEIGYELTDDNNRVIGEIEIAWIDKKIGYVTEEYQDIVDSLTKRGWTIIGSAEELQILINGGE